MYGIRKSESQVFLLPRILLMVTTTAVHTRTIDMYHTTTESALKSTPFLRNLALLLIVALTAATGSARAQKFDFRAVHLIEGAGAIDVHFLNREQPSIVGLDYESMSAVSPGLPVGTGTYNLKMTPTGTGLAGAILDQDFSVASSTDYEAIAYGSTSVPKLAVLSRSKSKVPGPGQALLRVLHGASVADSFDVYLGAAGGTPLLANIRQDSSSKYATVDGVAATLVITRNASTQPIAQFIMPLSPLTYNTLVITGSSVGSLKVYHLNGSLQNPAAIKLPVLQGSDIPPAFIRAVNAWPQKTVPNVDIYLNNEARTRKLPYRSATERYGPLTSDSATISFVTAGDNPGNALLTARIDLQPDTAYAVVLTQFNNGGRTNLLLKRAISDKTTSSNDVRIRVANANDFFGPITIVLQPSVGDTVHYDDVDFLSNTDFREMTAGNIDLKAYRMGQSDPLFTGNLTIAGGSILTFLVVGDKDKLAVDILNDSTAVLQSPMRSFDPALSVPTEYLATTRALALVNSPNPFSENTRIGFRLPQPTHVTVSLFDALGRIVATPLDEDREAGEQELVLDATELPPGTYTCLLRTDDGTTAVRQMVVVR